MIAKSPSGSWSPTRKALATTTMIVALALAGTGCGPDPGVDQQTQPTQTDVPFRSDGSLSFLRDGEPLATIDIEIADTDSARTRGLMQRSSLGANTGMLFIFPTSGPQSFWMANTQISLDILFADSDSSIVDIHKYTRPLSSDNVGGDHMSRFVVEVPAGFTDTNGIVEGDRIRW